LQLWVIKLKKILFVAGFLKEKKDVERSEKYRSVLERELGRSVILFNYGDEPSERDLHQSAWELWSLYNEVKPCAIIAHSMGTLVVRDMLKFVTCFNETRIPIIFIEGPNNGIPLWKMILTSYHFPLTRKCVRNMWRGSIFMKNLILRDDISNNNILEIQGSFAQWWLTKSFIAGRGIFEKIPESKLVIFPEVDHRDLPANREVIMEIQKFLTPYLPTVTTK